MGNVFSYTFDLTDPLLGSVSGGECTLMPSSSTCRLLPETDYCSVVQARNSHGLLSQRVRSTGISILFSAAPGYVRVEALSCAIALSHPCPSCDPLVATGCKDVRVHWYDFSLPYTGTDPTYTISIELLVATDWLVEGSPLVVVPADAVFDLQAAAVQMSQEGQHRATVCAKVAGVPSVCSHSTLSTSSRQSLELRLKLTSRDVVQ